MGENKIKNKQGNGDNGIINRHLWLILAIIGAAVTAIVGIMVLGSSDNNSDEDFVPEVTGAPRVSVSEDLVDYGDVKLNTTIETVFDVRNLGDQTLIILDEPVVEVVRGC